MRPGRDVLFTPLADGGVLVDLNGRAYRTLNPTGALVWRTLAGGGTVDDAAAALVEAHAVALEPARVDAAAFAALLRDERLLVDDGTP